jgi:ubiquinone/menaquinone biosynthesis C-methylase UbiE
VADGALDAVVCAFGIGHFPYPEASVAKFLRSLKVGGLVAFSWWDTSAKHRIQGLIRDAAAAVGAAACGCRRAIPACVHGCRRVSAPAGRGGLADTRCKTTVHASGGGR